MSKLKLVLAQINATVGALAQNAEIIIKQTHNARQNGADVICFPELSLSGYPAEDLILNPSFVADCKVFLQQIVSAIPADICCVLGMPWQAQDKVFNSAVVIINNQVSDVYHKRILPNYSVFDERRVFSSGDTETVFSVKGVKLGIHICEDSWHLMEQTTQALVGEHIDILLNLSASPYHTDKESQRVEVLSATADRIGAHMLYCNLVGGQDELVFDGGSLVISNQGELLKRAPVFSETLLFVTYDSHDGQIEQDINHSITDDNNHSWSLPPDSSMPPGAPADDLSDYYAALTLGLKDYVNKNGFEKVVVALSGGIDSALVAALAVDALGSERVYGITMPSQYSSDETLSDAGLLAKNLNIELHTVPIKNLFNTYLDELGGFWQDREWDATEENLQARIRGNIIMAFSNKMNWLVLTTGNKSEYATGYATLYGDMCGGFAVIKDVPKTKVFALCEWRNRISNVPFIPETTITRPPSAELRPDQKDSDSLPPYEVLDTILECYVEKNQTAAQITTQFGFERSVVEHVIRLVNINEHKRRQSPPGVKVTSLAFGRDRRMPITNHYS